MEMESLAIVGIFAFLYFVFLFPYYFRKDEE